MEPGRARLRGAMWAFHLALPLLGLWLLVARPAADVRWEHHPSHFWLIVGVAALNVAIALAIARAALRRTDGRLYLVACAFLAGAGFLGLHALATPGVLLDGPNEGFALASPVGLAVAAVFAVASSLNYTPQRSAALLRHRNLLLGGLVALVLAWGADSLLGLPPLSAAPVIAMAASRNWHLSWWEWHLLMAAGFGLVAYSAEVQYRREGTAAGLFDSVGSEHTARQIRAEYGQALERLVGVIERHERAGGWPDERLAVVTAGLASRFGLTERQSDVLGRAAEALAAEREQIRHLDALVAVGESARAIETESGLLRAALARIGDGFGRDEVRIGLVTDGRLVFPADLGGAPPDTAAAQRALATKAPVETADGWVLPLLVKDNPAGVLAARRTHGRYGERDRPVLASLASLLSVTLENARLYHQLDGLFRSYLSP